MAALLYPVNTPHPHPLPWFNTWRTCIYNFVTRDLANLVAENKRHILVTAPVKSGKREIVEAISMVFPVNAAHYFVTSLDRKDVKLQSTELERYGIRTCVVAHERDSVIADIRANVAVGKRAFLIIDEADYGSGSTQKLKEVFDAFVENPHVVFIYFSATSEETEASAITERPDYAELEFTPPPEYCGAEYFVEANLVFEPEAFLRAEEGNVSISRHGLDVIRDSITPDRHIGVVRIAGRSIPAAMLENELVKDALRLQLGTSAPNGRPWAIKVITDKHPLAWEDRQVQIGYTRDDEVNHLFFIFQTCTRGTDLKGWHHKLAFWHDVRSCRDNSNLNTLVQAILRPAHYSNTPGYGGRPQPVRMYVDRLVMRYAAFGDLDSYIGNGGRPPTRTRKTRTRYEYDIREVATFADLAGLCEVTGQPVPTLDVFPMVNGFRQTAGFGMERAARVLRTWAVEEARAAARAQYNRRQHFRFVPCYRDVANAGSLMWLATRKVGRQQQAQLPIAATRGSMYGEGAGR
jgi:hypothetical protein